MTVVCGFLFGIFTRNSDRHPPSSLAQPPPSDAQTGLSAIQPKHPRTHLPPLPPTPRAATALRQPLPATPSRLTAAAATTKSPSDAGATATVVDATTVATTSDLRRSWRPHLPPGSQQVVELDHFILAVKGHNSATSTVLTRLPQLAGPERRRPASSMREFPLVGDTASNVCTRVPFCLLYTSPSPRD